LFHVHAGRCQPIFFRIGGELRVSLPPPARRTDTREHRTVRGAPRLRVARPVPGGGQVGSPDQAPVSAGAGFNPGRVHATSSRIGEGNTTFLDPVAEDPIDSRLPVYSGCRHTCSMPDHHRDGGRGGLRTASVVSGVFLSRSLFGDYFLIEFKRPSGSQTLRTWVPDACLVRRALSLRFPARCDR